MTFVIRENKSFSSIRCRYCQQTQTFTKDVEKNLEQFKRDHAHGDTRAARDRTVNQLLGTMKE